MPSAHLSLPLRCRDNQRTFRPKKKHVVGTKRYELHKYAQSTLGAGAPLHRLRCASVLHVRCTPCDRAAHCYAFRVRSARTYISPHRCAAGNLREAVTLPRGEDVNEWLAVNSTRPASGFCVREPGPRA